MSMPRLKSKPGDDLVLLRMQQIDRDMRCNLSAILGKDTSTANWSKNLAALQSEYDRAVAAEKRMEVRPV